MQVNQCVEVRAPCHRRDNVPWGIRSSESIATAKLNYVDRRDETMQVKRNPVKLAIKLVQAAIKPVAKTLLRDPKLPV